MVVMKSRAFRGCQSHLFGKAEGLQKLLRLNLPTAEITKAPESHAA